MKADFGFKFHISNSIKFIKSDIELKTSNLEKIILLK
jgi:hypothetical protein